jgi:hypothetical protein
MSRPRERRFIDPADQTPRVQWFVILNFRDEKGLGMNCNCKGGDFRTPRWTANINKRDGSRSRVNPDLDLRQSPFFSTVYPHRRTLTLGPRYALNEHHTAHTWTKKPKIRARDMWLEPGHSKVVSKLYLFSSNMPSSIALISGEGKKSVPQRCDISGPAEQTPHDMGNVRTKYSRSAMCVEWNRHNAKFPAGVR